MAHVVACFVLTLSVVSCGGETPSYAEGEGGWLPADGEACTSPSEGCPCTDEPPQACYVEQGARGGDLVCGAGTRTCEGGTWGACEHLETFTVAQGSALVIGPVACSLCDPNCNTSVDRPDDGDLTPGNSVDVIYDPGRGGVTLEDDPFETPMLVDSDGDGVVDVADDCPTVAGDPRYFGCAPSGEPGIYYELPFDGPAELEPCSLAVELNSVDVYFLVDTTGSMGGEIYNLRRGLTSGTYVPGCPGGIIGAMDCTIPDIQFGVAAATRLARSSARWSGRASWRRRWPQRGRPLRWRRSSWARTAAPSGRRAERARRLLGRLGLAVGVLDHGPLDHAQPEPLARQAAALEAHAADPIDHRGLTGVELHPR